MKQKQRIQVMINADQAHQIKREAMQNGLSVSTYVRTLLNNQSRPQ